MVHQQSLGENFMTLPDIIIREVKSKDSALHNILLSLFAEIFPSYMRYLPHIRSSLEQGDTLNPRVLPHHWLVKLADNEGAFIGFELFNYLHRYNIGFGRYIGTRAEKRNEGVGMQLIRASVKQIASDARRFGRPEPLGFCAEVESPRLATTPEEREIRERRLRYFQESCGAVELNLDYLEPVMIRSFIEATEWTQPPTSMHFIVFPCDPSRTSFTPEETKKMAEGVLLDHYGLPADNNLVQHVLESVKR
jgi:hypothetical protein